MCNRLKFRGSSYWHVLFHAKISHTSFGHEVSWKIKHMTIKLRLLYQIGQCFNYGYFYFCIFVACAEVEVYNQCYAYMSRTKATNTVLVQLLPSWHIIDIERLRKRLGLSRDYRSGIASFCCLTGLTSCTQTECKWLLPTRISSRLSSSVWYGLLVSSAPDKKVWQPAFRSYFVGYNGISYRYSAVLLCVIWVHVWSAIYGSWQSSTTRQVDIIIMSTYHDQDPTPIAVL